MTKIRTIIGAILLMVLSGCNNSIGETDFQHQIIPQPVKINPGKGKFVFSKNTVLKVENQEQADIANQLLEKLQKAAGLSFSFDEKQGDIVFITDSTLSSEAYRLEVSPSEILIKASGNSGFFYALQSLRQLLPATIESDTFDISQEYSIPVCTVDDQPRFEYRGLMLDVARYFIPKESVLKIIDAASMLKINKLHMHLVDDNGWRLEIKKYPKLTEIGAWRVDRKEFFSARKNQKKGEKTTLGGFYTQQDMKEIVAYAASKQIDVIPEIEMPAHTNSSLAAFPKLACPVVKEFIGVIPGIGGKNAEIIYCAGNENVFAFLEDIIDEVVGIFPSEYIHLGGDEAIKTYWKICPKCQARMRAESIPTEEELQGYFMKRMCKYVQQKGKKPMGWDELTNSELPEGVTIFGWQGYGNAALKAAKQGHDFILTPARVLYLIRYQGPQWFEPRTYFGNNTLKDVYQYEPVQSDWNPQVTSLLKGVQASLWTEFCNSAADVEYMIFPRLAASAEVAWSPAGSKDWSCFLTRLDVLTAHWDKMGINYAKSMFNLDHTVTTDNNQLKVTVSSIRPDLTIRYTTDGSEPTINSVLFSDSILVTQEMTISAATFDGKIQKGETLVLPLKWNKATGKKVTSKPKADRLYVLTNGLRGSDKHSDFEWCGWYDTDMTLTVDLEKEENISRIVLGTVTNNGMGVHFPKSIQISVSNDNHQFKTIASLNHTSKAIFEEGIFVKDFPFDNLAEKARYVRITANNPGICPDDHVKAGHKTWIYFDEITIE